MDGKSNRSFQLVENCLCFQESVLDQTTAEEDIEDIYEPLAQGDCQRLEAEKQKFNKAIDTLDSALVRLEQLWISNVSS